MAQYEDLKVDRGTDFQAQLELITVDGSPKDLTNYTSAAKMKKSYNSDSDNTTSFITTVAGSTVNLNLTNSQTELLNPGRYVYDVEISFVDSDGETIIERILEGNIQVTPSVTR